MYNDVNAVGKIIKQLKSAEEASDKKIHELTMRLDQAKEDIKHLRSSYEKRINTLIRDFVNVFKSLA